MCSQVYFVMVRGPFARKNPMALVHQTMPAASTPRLLPRFPWPPGPPHNAPVSRRAVELTAGVMVRVCRRGLFPGPETRRGARLYWLAPERRGVLPLDRFHLSRRLARTPLSDAFTVAL